jgi:hypothetical protein
MTTEKELRRVEKFNQCLVALNELAQLQLLISKREFKLRKEMQRYE